MISFSSNLNAEVKWNYVKSPKYKTELVKEYNKIPKKAREVFDDANLNITVYGYNHYKNWAGLYNGNVYIESYSISWLKSFYRRRGVKTNLSTKNLSINYAKCTLIHELGHAFDYNGGRFSFTDEFKKLKQEQEACWATQLELAAAFDKPLVIHGRKCTEMFFRDYRKLKKLPSVMFHSWAGTLNEARSLLERGVNAYFSFGKPLIIGKKSAIECVKSLPLERIFLETDAPYQTLKGEEFTSPLQIIDVYNKACELRGICIDELSEVLYESMRGFYRVPL